MMFNRRVLCVALLCSFSLTSCIFGQQEATLDASADQSADVVPDPPDASQDPDPDTSGSDTSPDQVNPSDEGTDLPVSDCQASSNPTDIGLVFSEDAEVVFVRFISQDSNAPSSLMVGLDRGTLTLVALTQKGEVIQERAFDVANVSEGDTAKHLSAVAIQDGVRVLYGAPGTTTGFELRDYIYNGENKDFKESSFGFFPIGDSVQEPLDTFISPAGEGCLAASVVYNGNRGVHGRSIFMCGLMLTPSGRPIPFILSDRAQDVGVVRHVATATRNQGELDRQFELRVVGGAGGDNGFAAQAYEYRGSPTDPSPSMTTLGQTNALNQDGLESFRFISAQGKAVMIDSNYDVTRVDFASNDFMVQGTGLSAQAIDLIALIQAEAFVLSYLSDATPYLQRFGSNDMPVAQRVQLSDAVKDYVEIQSVSVKGGQRAHLVSYEDGSNRNYHYFLTRIRGIQEELVCEP